MLPILVMSCETTELTIIHKVFRGIVECLHACSWQTAYSFLDFPYRFSHITLLSIEKSPLPTEKCQALEKTEIETIAKPQHLRKSKNQSSL